MQNIRQELKFVKAMQYVMLTYYFYNKKSEINFVITLERHAPYTFNVHFLLRNDLQAVCMKYAYFCNMFVTFD